MYSAFSEYKQNLVPMHECESFHPDITDKGEIRDQTHIKKFFSGDDRSYNICGYNSECQILAYDIFSSNNNAAEDLEPFDESENDMDNFDPALFCPDIIMELGDTPIKIETDEVTNDDNTNEESILTSVPNEGEKMADGSSDLTVEEDELKKKTYGVDHPVQYTRIHCTTCNDHLGSALSDSNNLLVHPLLKVLICKACHDFYTSGEFEKDNDGSETYCRWCGQGGLVICCSNCEYVFCAKCIRNNFGRKILAGIRNSDEWTCYKCDPSQLIQLRVQCAALMDYVRRETARASTLENATAFSVSFMNTDHSRCCIFTNTKSNEPKKMKRKHSEDDQDYDPNAEQLSCHSSSSSVKSVSSVCDEANTAKQQKPLTIVPKQVNSTKSRGTVTQGCQDTATVANSTVKTKVTFVSNPKPILHRVNPPFIASDARGLPVDSNQIRVLPNGQRVAIMAPRNFVPSSAGVRQTSTRKTVLQPDRNYEQQRKKMCYETAVRAASRINSDLFCNLIKLREDKTTARKLDDLVAIHNKLQETLHNSINSLIRLRKTLADVNNKPNAPNRLQQSSASNHLLFNPDIVSNLFRTTQSQAFRNFNIGYAANFEEAKFVGIKEQKESEENTNSYFKPNATNCVGSSFQSRPPGASLLIISDSSSNIKG